MPRYDFACDECKVLWEEVRRMKYASEPSNCPQCGAEGRRVFNASGMIKVEGGASPTRFGSGYHRGTPRADDPGFVKEFESIWEADPMVNVNTGEGYELDEDERGHLRAVLPSEKKQEEDRKAFINRMTSNEYKRVRKEALAKSEG